MPSDHEHPFSAAQGRPLLNVKGFHQGVTERLSELGINDAEQLVAVTAVPKVLEGLSQHLKVAPAELTQAVESARQTLPEQLASELSRPVQTQFALGAFDPTPASNAATAKLMPKGLAAKALPAALPTSVNHAGSMGPVKNQGSRGTCVAFGSTAMHEYWNHVIGRPQKFSEQFLYEEIKRVDGHPNDCGTWLVYAVQVLKNLGECLESVWGYNPNQPCNHNGTEPANARANAAQFKITANMLNAKDVHAIKAALAGNSNVPFCIPVYNSWYQSAETKRTGRITMRIGNEPRVGGHCMCFLGYQDDHASPGGGYFILRNSWGPNNWGHQCPYGAGNGTIPYQYIANDCTEAATMPARVRRVASRGRAPKAAKTRKAAKRRG